MWWGAFAAGTIQDATDLFQTGGTLGVIGVVGFGAWRLFVAYQTSVTTALRDQVKSEADARQRCDEELAEQRKYVAELHAALDEAAARSRAKDTTHWTEMAELRGKLSMAGSTIAELRRILEEKGVRFDAN